MSPIPPEIVTTFRRNLAALETIDPGLAKQLEELDWFADVNFLPALDGTRTAFAPGLSRSGWLAGSGAPNVRETILCDQMAKETANVIFPGLGQGVGLRYLLEQFKPWQAVFVWEPELRHIALSLALYDFSEAITSRRVIFLTHPDLKDGLVDYFTENPFFKVPTKMIGWPWHSDKRLTEISQMIERAIDEINPTIGNRIAEGQLQLNDLYHQIDTTKSRRLLIVSLLGYPLLDRLAEDLNDGARKAGLESGLYKLQVPADHGPVTLLNHLLEQKPDLLISIGLNKGQWPIAVPDKVHFYSFLTRPGMLLNDNIKEALLQPMNNEQYVVGDKTDCQDLGDRFGAAQLLLAEMAVHCDVSLPRSAETEQPIGLVADCPVSNPEKLGIGQESHKRLWHAVEKLIASRPLAVTNAQTGKLIEKASRQCGVQMTDSDLINHFRFLIEHYLAPAVVSTTLAEQLIAAGINIRLLGSGWDAVPNLATIATPLPEHTRDLNEMIQSCEFLLCPSNKTNWNEIVFAGLCAGKPVIVKRLPNDKLTEIADIQPALVVLDPHKEVVRQIKQVRLHVQALREAALKAQSVLREQFSYERLLKNLLGE